MKQICLKRFILSYASLIALILLFAIGSDKAVVGGIEEFIYMLPCFVYAWCTQYFYLVEVK